MDLPCKDCTTHQAANFLVNVAMRKIKIHVSVNFPVYALRISGTREIIEACLKDFFNSPKNSTLNKAVVLSKYYSNGGYLPLVNKLTNAS
jgi:hypothetical protein